MQARAAAAAAVRAAAERAARAGPDTKDVAVWPAEPAVAAMVPGAEAATRAALRVLPQTRNR